MKRLLMIFMMFILCSISTSCYNIVEERPSKEDPKLKGEEPYTEGDGTVDNPYVIDTKGKLIYLSNQTNDGKGRDLCYELQVDINLEGIKWNPIYRFKGYFNGNGYEISNFSIQNKNPYKFYNHSIGFFESNAGTIEGLGVTNFYIDARWLGKTMWSCVGGITGTNTGIIKNCYTNCSLYVENFIDVGDENNIYFNEAYIGGIAGINQKFSSESRGEIYNCYSSISITKEVDIKLYYDTIAYMKNDSSGKITNCAVSGQERKKYYINELGWSEDIWDFDNPEFQNGGYLKLKRTKKE